MKKQATLFLALFIGIATTKAENPFSLIKKDTSTYNCYVGVHLGIASPVGEFSDTKQGGAKTGKCYGATLNMPFSKYFIGPSLRFNYSSYDFSGDAFVQAQQNIVNVTTFYNGHYYVITPGASTTYTHYEYMGGIMASFPYHKFSIDLRVLGGMMTSIKSSQNAYLTDRSTNQDITMSQGSSKQKSGIFCIGSTVRYLVGKNQNFFICLNIDYTSSMVDYQFQTHGLTVSNLGQVFLTDYSEKKSFNANSINTSAGIGLLLGK